MASPRVLLAASWLVAALAPAGLTAVAQAESPPPATSVASPAVASPAAASPDSAVEAAPSKSPKAAPSPPSEGPSPSPSPSALLPLPAPSRTLAPAPSSAPPAQRSPSPVQHRAAPSPTPVVTIIPAPSDAPASPVTVQSAGPLPPIELGSIAPSPDPVQTAAAKPAATTSGSDRVTRLVRLLLVGALLLGIGGGAGLYLTRNAR